jgi:iron complex outermembrane receptor protein
MSAVPVRRCLLGLALAIATPCIALAESALSFDIPQGPLGETLARIARQGGQVLSVNPAWVAGRQAPAVRGQMTPTQAAQQVLTSNGLTLKINSGGSWTIEPLPRDGALNLPESQINAATDENAWGPVHGFVAKRTATATKTDTALIETPQTVNVVTADQIRAQGALSVTQALRYTPGITGGGFPDRTGVFDEPTARGFTPTPLYLDGLHLPYGGGSTGGALQIDPYTLERIEVLKGPASVLYGQNQPGGIINLVSKRPTAEPLHEVTLGGGSQDRRYGAFDLGGPLDEQGELLYRVVGSTTDKNGEIDYVQHKRYLLAPSLTWNIDDRTHLTVYGQYQKDNDVPEAQGLPAYGTVFSTPNGRISRSTFIGEPGVNSYDRDQFTLGYEFSRELNDTWTLRQNARYADVDDRYRAPLHGYTFVANPQTGADDQRYQRRYAVDWAQHNKVFGLDNQAQANFNTGPIAHTLLLGADYYHFNSRFLGLYQYSAPAIDLYNPVYGQAINYSNPYRWNNTVEQTGLYVQDQLKFGQWFLTVGGRYDWAETDNASKGATATGYSHTNSRDEKFSGRAGLGYLFDNGVTPYLSYAESFLPVSGTDRDGKPFEPSTGKQYEAGVKYQPPGQESFVQASVYQIDQKNVLTTDPVDPTFSGQSGAVRSRGVELEAKAQLDQQWAVLASVARNQTKYTEDNDGRQGRLVAGTSPLTASLWLDYHFAPSNVLRGVHLGLGTRYVRGSDGTETATNHFTIPSYTVYDALLAYDLGQSPLSLKGVELKVNVNNLLDEKYVSSCTSVWDCYYGEGRTLTADVSYRW